MSLKEYLVAGAITLGTFGAVVGLNAYQQWRNGQEQQASSPYVESLERTAVTAQPGDGPLTLMQRCAPDISEHLSFDAAQDRFDDLNPGAGTVMNGEPYTVLKQPGRCE